MTRRFLPVPLGSFMASRRSLRPRVFPWEPDKAAITNWRWRWGIFPTVERALYTHPRGACQAFLAGSAGSRPPDSGMDEIA